jgi:hypothetical protein
MSSISSRPRVQKVSGPVLTTIGAAGCALAAKALQSPLGSMHRALSTKTQQATPATAPLAEIREQFAHQRLEAFDQAKLEASPVEILRTAGYSQRYPCGSDPSPVQ